MAMAFILEFLTILLIATLWVRGIDKQIEREQKEKQDKQ